MSDADKYLCHFAVFSKSSALIKCGSCSVSNRKAAFLSEGAHCGYPLGTASVTDATNAPVNISHSLGWKWSGCIPLTRCSANIGRSALNRALPTKYSTLTSTSAAKWTNLSSVFFAAPLFAPSEPDSSACQNHLLNTSDKNISGNSDLSVES